MKFNDLLEALMSFEQRFDTPEEKELAAERARQIIAVAKERTYADCSGCGMPYETAYLCKTHGICGLCHEHVSLEGLK